MSNNVKVGLLGCGIVGGADRPDRHPACLRSESQGRDGYRDRSDRRAESRQAARGRVAPREVDDHPFEVVNDPDIDVVVEAIGGIEPAKELILAALRNKKHVVTANKELLSTNGKEVMDAAEEAGVDLLFEASVAGGIPIIRPMKESLAGDRVRRVMGLVNGTTNFILTRMSETGESFAESLAEAERLGYTEMDPSADIEGYDAAAKLAILASLAFNSRVVAGDVEREGISSVKASDIVAAHELGYEIKLLAVAEMDEGQIAARVHPSMVPKTHPLAAVRDVYNAVFVESQESGELMFYGRGAGGGPTGSAVVGDLVEVARNIVSGGRSAGCTCYHQRARIRPHDESRVRYYVVLSVLDQPGVLSTVAGVFAQHGVSIASVRQEGAADEATLALITHSATEGQHGKTFADLSALDSVKEITSQLRVEGTGEE